MTVTTQTLEPLITRKGEGEARWWFDCLAETKVSAEQTGGLVSIIQITEPPNPDGTPGPLHVHNTDHEGFWLLEGSAKFDVGETTIEASAGDFVFGPAAIPHRYTVGPEGCRMLFIMTPGGLEKLIRETSRPAEERTLPPPMTEEPDWAHVAAAAKANGCELLEG